MNTVPTGSGSGSGSGSATLPVTIYFLILSGTQSNQEKCEEYEDELAGIREDLIDMLGDGWVVKLTDSSLLPRLVGCGRTRPHSFTL
jgi:hypothetical protein